MGKYPSDKLGATPGECGTPLRSAVVSQNLRINKDLTGPAVPLHTRQFLLSYGREEQRNEGEHFMRNVDSVWKSLSGFTAAIVR
jgi:hypothetical protein